MTTTLVGMFYIKHGVDYYHTGEVLAAIGQDSYLMQPDIMHDGIPVQMPMYVIGMLDVTDITEMGTPQYEFFQLRADLEAYVKWMDSPSSPAKVFSLVPKAKEE